MAVKTLRQRMAVLEEKRASPNEVLDAVCEVFGVTRAGLSGPSRMAHIAEPRQAAMYLLREDGLLKLELIGELLGRRHHSSIIWGISQVEERLAIAANSGRAATAVREVQKCRELVEKIGKVRELIERLNK